MSYPRRLTRFCVKIAADTKPESKGLLDLLTDFIFYLVLNGVMA